MSRQPYLDAVQERVIVFDGAFGTFVQDLDLGPDDFGGLSLEGCNEMLCLTRPSRAGSRRARNSTGSSSSSRRSSFWYSKTGRGTAPKLPWLR